jgi:hypothetical protein
MITMDRTEWNEEAERLLAGAAGNDPTYTLADLRREVQTGAAGLWVFHHGAEKLGYAVLFIEDFGGTKELVLQAGEAFASWPAAALKALHVIKAYALQSGCASMRSHIQGNGQRARVLKRAGFRRAEIVMRETF